MLQARNLRSCFCKVTQRIADSSWNPWNAPERLFSWQFGSAVRAGHSLSNQKVLENWLTHRGRSQENAMNHAARKMVAQLPNARVCVIRMG
jgi:hypothetical protein